MKIQIDDKDFELLLEYDQIKKRTRFLGIQLNVDYEKTVPVFVAVLNGSFMFMADLMKEVEIASEITFVKVASYNADASTGEVKKLLGLNLDLKGRDVIIVEDIVDTGLTLSSILEEIKKQEPASVSVCTLLFKPQSLLKPVDELHYVGFEIPNDFVVGYGLDYKELGRNLKDIYRALPVLSET
ncbi:hypoxanthine phosphoribosyltransferase [Rubrolithibacter danxiaensis]|uniref:hypoxanthine phosphoribosyltransferase n=1 Tax=Rubrolithibacter danxiaensis TaxID=3390805 RepID=UPI003BF77846